jgi:hypothetical protein
MIGGMTPERWEAGERYVSSLRDLGFDPETVMWAFDKRAGEFNLAFVTTIVDRIGTKAIYEILFKAYDRAVTPREFDPWVVSLYSPQTFFAREFAIMLETNPTVEALGDAQIVGQVALGVGDYTARREWIYVLRSASKVQSKHQIRAWQAFEANVDRLAA